MRRISLLTVELMRSILFVFSAFFIERVLLFLWLNKFTKSKDQQSRILGSLDLENDESKPHYV